MATKQVFFNDFRKTYRLLEQARLEQNESLEEVFLGNIKIMIKNYRDRFSSSLIEDSAKNIRGVSNEII